ITEASLSGLLLTPVSTTQVTPGVAGVGAWLRNSACMVLAWAVGSGTSAAAGSAVAANRASAVAIVGVILAVAVTWSPRVSAQDGDADAVAQSGQVGVGVAVGADAHPDRVGRLPGSGGRHLVGEVEAAAVVGLGVAELASVLAHLAAKTDRHPGGREGAAL